MLNVLINQAQKQNFLSKYFKSFINFFQKSVSIKCFRCRKTQAVFDKCMSDNLNIDRLPYDYYTRVQIHKTARPRPPPREKTVYEDATPYLPDGTEKPPAKYGSRFHWMW